MNILFVAPEVAPFAKTGGLADVAGALPLALHRRGHDVRIVLPGYRQIRAPEPPEPLEDQRLVVTIDGEPQRVAVRRTLWQKVPVYLIDHPEYFDRQGLYGSAEGDFPDNGRRFGLFARAALQLLPRLPFRPDVLHLHDWQCGLPPVLLATELRHDPFYAAMATVFTIHNLAYQGLFEPSLLRELALDPDLFRMEALEYYGRISLLKGGVLFSDAVTTVSPGYCREIQTPEFGCGFEGILRSRRLDLFGILNGLDTDLWDPATDPALPAPFNASEPEKRREVKAALQQELGLEVRDDLPLVAMVTRLDAQKGIDLVEQAWPELLDRQLQLVLLGTGSAKHTAFFARRRDEAPLRISINLTFDEGLSRRIYGGSDIFLMPSRYEPCGLSQLIAMRYGSLPVVRRTGGLADTVIDLGADPKRGSGFTFEEARPEQMLQALDRALELFGHRERWQEVMRRGMTRDFSWERSAERYEQIYRHAMEQRNARNG